MFDFERATDYIRSLELPGSTLCEEIQKDALAGDVPIIRPETASFLLFLISLKKPLSILEVGTAGLFGDSHERGDASWCNDYDD